MTIRALGSRNYQAGAGVWRGLLRRRRERMSACSWPAACRGWLPAIPLRPTSRLDHRLLGELEPRGDGHSQLVLARLDRRRCGPASSICAGKGHGRLGPAFLCEHHEPADFWRPQRRRKSRLSAWRRRPRADALCRAARSDRCGQSRCHKLSWRRRPRPCRAERRGAECREPLRSRCCSRYRQ